MKLDSQVASWSESGHKSHQERTGAVNLVRVGSKYFIQRVMTSLAGLVEAFLARAGTGCRGDD